MAFSCKSCPGFVFPLLLILSLVLTIVILVGIMNQFQPIHYIKALKIIVYCDATLLTTCFISLMFIIINRSHLTVCTPSVLGFLWGFLSPISSGISIILLTQMISGSYLNSYYLYDETEKILVYYIACLMILCTFGLLVVVCKCNDSDEILQGNSVQMGHLGSSNHGFTGDYSGGGDCGGDGGGDGGGCGGDGGGGD